MNFVPYAFCDSLATLLSDESTRLILNLRSANPQFRTWISAVRANIAKRQNFEVAFDYLDGVWNYDILSADHVFTIKEFKNLDKEYVRVYSVRIGGHTYVTFKSSEKELSEIAAFTASLVNFSTFSFSNYLHDPVDALLAIPGFFRDCSLSEIYFCNCSSTSLEEFLLPQLKSRWLDRVSMLRDPGLGEGGELQAALDDFRRRKPN